MIDFHSLRLMLRALLISSLLVLGHVLLVATASLDREPFKTDLASAIESTSGLIFVTLLWTCFVLMEEVELSLSKGGHRDDETSCTFTRLWVELGMTSLAVAGWMFYAAEGLLLIRHYATHPLANISDILVIPSAWTIGFICIVVLHLQLLFSIVMFVVNHGHTAVCMKDFWTGKTGHWTGRILLDEEEGQDLSTLPQTVEEKQSQ